MSRDSFLPLRGLVVFERLILKAYKEGKEGKKLFEPNVRSGKP